MRGNFAIQITYRCRVKARIGARRLAAAGGCRSPLEYPSDGSRAGASVCRILFLLTALIYLPGTALHAQGFGKFDKSKITLHRKLPPVVRFTGSSDARLSLHESIAPGF